MIMGAFSSILFINIVQSSGAALPPQLLLLLAVLIAAAVGVLVSMAHAYASINMKGDQVISGTAINMFAPAFAIFAARMIRSVQQIPFSNTFRITKVPVLGRYSRAGAAAVPEYLYHHLSGYPDPDCFNPCAVPYQVWAAPLLRRTIRGSDAAGINVYRMQYAGVLISGVLGGLGGLVFVVPTSTNFNADVAGYGFLALAVLIFGQWKPVRIMWASLFFGLMKAVAAAYSGIPFLAATGIPSYVYKMIPYLATLIVLIFTSRNSQAPRASGVPYDKGQR